MPDDNPPAMLPGTAVVGWDDLRRIALTAATDAARQIKEDALTKEDVESIAESAADASIDRLLERVFDVAPGDAKGLIELRKDFTAMRAARETREAMMRHGLMAVVGLLITGIGTAVWLAIKGAK